MKKDRVYIIIYSSGFARKHINDSTQKRCDLALQLARGFADPIFLLGAGLAEYGYTHGGFSSLADDMTHYLEGKGISKDRIVTNPIGYDTVGETAAAIEVMKLEGEAPVIAVSSWYHIPRIFIIWRWGFKKPVTVRGCAAPFSFKTIFKELIAIPVSLIEARAFRSRV